METKKSNRYIMQRTKMRCTGMALIFYLLMAITACTTKTHEIPVGDYKKVGDIPPPQGYLRDTAKKESFDQYLQDLELKTDKTVYLYNGQKKVNQDAQYAVLNVDVGNKDLQQCADAVMRLRAEFLYKQKRYSDIHFNFTNGERADYVGYAEGDRPIVLNNQVRWSRTATKDYSYKTFRKYLDMVFTYAGTMSLSAELKKITVDEIQPGDVFIQTGYPFGHAVIVVDVAINKETGHKAFMLAQSYMPAQDIHILKNPEKTNDPWYYSNFGHDLVTPEWIFKSVDLKRF
jgi:hypothetical protein